jgi:Endopolygalacturonase
MKRLISLALALLMISASAPSPHAATHAATPLPGQPNRAESPRYRLSVDGRPVIVREERFSFDVGMFDLARAATVEVEVLSDFTSATLKPDRHGLKLEREGRKLRFTLAAPLKLVLQVDQFQPLAILATPPETDVPARGAPDVIYFGPGVTDAGVIRPKSGQTVYLAPGALVKGRVEAKNVSNVSIRGRGILETTGYSRREDKTHGILFENSRHIRVEGVGVRAYHTWWQTLFLNSRDIEVAHMNLFGVGVNTDGVDIDGVRDFLVRDTFIRAEDDGLGWHSLDARANGEPVTERARATDIVIWNTGAGNGIRIGASMETQLWRDILIENTDILMHANNGAGIYSDFSDWAWAQDLVFRNVVIDRPKSPIVFKILKTRYSNDTGFLDARGNIERLLFENVTMKGGTITLAGHDADHRIDQVYFNRCTLAGAPVRSLSDVVVNPHVTGVRFDTPLPPRPRPPSGRFEAEDLESATNVRPQLTYRDASLSGGKGRALLASAEGDHVDYELETLDRAGGAHRLKLAVKRGPASGKFRLSVDGVPVGAEHDLYAAKETVEVIDFGTVHLAASDTHSVRLTVSGRNSASRGHRLDVDYIECAAAGGR